MANREPVFIFTHPNWEEPVLTVYDSGEVVPNPELTLEEAASGFWDAILLEYAKRVTEAAQVEQADKESVN